jgi:hypothetical protein
MKVKRKVCRVCHLEKSELEFYPAPGKPMNGKKKRTQCSNCALLANERRDIEHKAIADVRSIIEQAFKDICALRKREK